MKVFELNKCVFSKITWSDGSNIGLESFLSSDDSYLKLHYFVNSTDCSYSVKIVSVPGKLTDHYNPMDKTINLSPDVYNGRHITAAAVAAHECGHAVQHATSYEWLHMRSQMVPMVSASNKMMTIIMLAGFFGAGVLHMFPISSVILVFIILQAVVTIFSLITLPVEFDASKRALIWLKSANITNKEELVYAGDALNWAARTYIVAAMAAASYLLYYIALYKD